MNLLCSTTIIKNYREMHANVASSRFQFAFKLYNTRAVVLNMSNYGQIHTSSMIAIYIFFY